MGGRKFSPFWRSIYSSRERPRPFPTPDHLNLLDDWNDWNFFKGDLMCTMIVHQAKIDGRGKGRNSGWIKLDEASVSYDHPYDMPLEHALNIDFVNAAEGPSARVAVELSVEAARNLVKTIEAVLAQAEQRGVLEDAPLALSR